MPLADCGLAAELVGLQNIKLESNERVWVFSIHLQEGEIIGVSKIPTGWKITAESYGEAAEYKDGGGEIQGTADFGHDALSAADLPKLGGLFLIEKSVIHKKSAVLSGKITISGPSGNRVLVLQPQNFLRREAVKN